MQVHAPGYRHRDGHVDHHEDGKRQAVHAVAVVQQRRALGTFFRYICDNNTYIARYDDLYDGHDNQIDVSNVDVSTNGIELIDREFIAAIREGREPNSSSHSACRRCRSWTFRKAVRELTYPEPIMIIDCHGHYTATPPGVGAGATHRRKLSPPTRSRQRKDTDSGDQ